MRQAVVDLMEQCRGAERKGDFAKRLGISRRLLDAIYAGDRNGSLRLAQALMREFPERREDVVRVFFVPENEHEQATNSANVPQEARP